MRVVGEAWEAERGLLTPVNRGLLAWMDGVEPGAGADPARGPETAAAIGEAIKVRPLAVYAELVR